jgi:manganese/zinc/iron transport system substrate-binding protein
MIGDAVRNMTDSTCTVNTLMGPGTDPHLFKPTKTSLDLLSDADIIIANGLHLEGKMQDILHKLARTKRVYFLAEGISPEKRIISDSASQTYDPHIWFDVALWKEALMEFRSEFENDEIIDSRSSDAYLNSLDELDRWATKEVDQIPADRRVLITAHDAFSYFGRAYKVEVIGLQGISTVSEYGLRDISNLVNTITDRQIPAVFIESSISPRSIQAVVEGCQQRGFETRLGGTLYSDALGPKDSNAETYIDMVRHNISTIKEGLK